MNQTLQLLTFNILWLQGVSCGGCIMAALESGRSGWFEELSHSGSG